MAHLYHILRIILCSLGIHSWGYKWKKFLVHNKKSNSHWAEYHTRVCKYCGKRQLRTRLPSMNGYDTNHWRNY